MSAVAGDRVVTRVSWFNDPKIRSLIVQFVLLGIIVWLCFEVVVNASTNLARLNQNLDRKSVV